MAFHPPRGFRKELLGGKAKVGLLVGSGRAQIVEIAACRGYDWVFLDGEHGEFLSVGDMLPLIRAADAFGIPAVVRVPRNDANDIAHVLDFGAIGICVPHVRTAEEAARAVRFAKYAPQGERAMSPYTRACGYTQGTEWDTYWRVANEETVVIVIIEDRVGVENVEAIAAVPGVDVVWIGTGDLGQDMGTAGKPGPHPELEAAMERGLRASQANGKASYFSLASHPVDAAARASAVKAAFAKGHRLLSLNEGGLLSGGLGDVAEVVKKALQS